MKEEVILTEEMIDKIALDKYKAELAHDYLCVMISNPAYFKHKAFEGMLIPDAHIELIKESYNLAEAFIKYTNGK